MRKNFPPDSNDESYYEKNSPSFIQDILEDVKVQIIEGFTQDAKKNLYQILRKEPDHMEAQMLLEQIQQSELKELFKLTPKSEIKKTENDYSSKILETKKLEKDHYLQEWNLMTKLNQILKKSSLQNKMDLAVSFFEMQLYSITIWILKQAEKHLENSNLQCLKWLTSLKGLIGWSFFSMGRENEAISEIQSVLKNQKITIYKKVELIYLMGRIHEYLSKIPEAIQYYQKVQKIQKKYRDTNERLKKLQ